MFSLTVVLVIHQGHIFFHHSGNFLRHIYIYKYIMKFIVYSCTCFTCGGNQSTRRKRKALGWWRCETFWSKGLWLLNTTFNNNSVIFGVRHHNEQLQQELSENIRTFLQRHEDSMDVPVSTILSDHCLQSSISTSAPSLNQVPSLTNVLIDSGASDSSRSYL
jgi:hypothetical protein